MQMKFVMFAIPFTSIKYTYTYTSNPTESPPVFASFRPVGNRKMRSNRRSGYHLRSNLWKMRSAKSCPSGMSKTQLWRNLNWSQRGKKHLELSHLLIALIIIINHHQLSSIIINYHLSPIIINYHQWWIIINYHQSSSISINYHQSSSIIINHHQLSSIIINYHLSSIIINYHQWWIIINYHQSSSISINYHQLSIIIYYHLLSSIIIN